MENPIVSDRKTLLYVIPVPNFFSQFKGVGGHIAHTYGVLRGFTSIGYDIISVMEESPPFEMPHKVKNMLLPMQRDTFVSRQLWNRDIIFLINNLLKVNQPQPRFCYIRYSGKFLPWYPILKKRLKKTPMVLEVNSFVSQRYRFLSLFDRLALSCSDIILSVSEKNKRDILQRVNKTLHKKILVLPNGVDINRVNCSPTRPGQHNKHEIKLGYVGIFKPHYGLEFLLDGFKILSQKYDNVSLHLYGAGIFEKQLKQLAKGNKKIYFHGSVPFEKIKKAYSNLDILIGTATPKTFQNSPIKLYEYMATGKPVIHARTPQVEKIAKKQNSVLLYDWNNPHQLVKQIKRLIQNPDVALSLSQRALDEVKSNHTWEQRMKRLDNFLRKLTKCD